MNDNKVLAIFRRLAGRNCILSPIPKQGAIGGEACQFQISSSADCTGKGPVIASETVRRWLSDGLIEPCGNNFRLSAAGRAWVKRRLCTTDDFQAQHQDRRIRMIDYEGARRPAVVNDAESPLRWLASRKSKDGAPLLTPYQLEAGERLRADYQFAGLTARVTASWSPTAQCQSSGGANDAASLQDNVLAARQRVVRAIAAVGPELSGILIDVCCHLKGLEEAEKTEGWPQRSGKVILQFALTRLARHYGLISDAELSEGVKRKLRHWGAEDYRPKINGGGMTS